MATWYCKIDAKVYGPYANDVLRQMAQEERLLPEDWLREGEAGEWFPAREMANLFPAAAPAPRHADTADDFEDDFDDDRPRRRRRRTRKPSNYYRIVFQNFREGGQWVTLVGATALLQAIFGVIAAAILRNVEGRMGVVVLIAAPIAAGILVFFWFIDVLIFGIPCTALCVRLDPRRHSVLDLFGYAFLIGTVVTLISIMTSCASQSAAEYMSLLYPFFHNGVLAYLLYTYWGLSPQRVWTLAGIRFGYQMLFLVVRLVLTMGPLQ